MRRFHGLILILAVLGGAAMFSPAPRGAQHWPERADSEEAGLFAAELLDGAALRGAPAVLASAPPSDARPASGGDGAPISPLARNRHPLPSPTRRIAKPTLSIAPLPSRATQEALQGGQGVIAGLASWFCLPGRSACTSGYPASCACAAAGPALRALLGQWRGRSVRVWRSDRRASVVVRLIDWCACPDGRVLDLYGSVYGQLDSLSSGLLDVLVEV